MVQRILKLFHSGVGSVHKAAILLALASISSSLLALFRDRLLAGTFGAGKTLDIYYSAFKIPDFLYIISLSIASVTVLIPFFLEKISVSQEESENFLNGVFTIFCAGMFFLAIIFFFIAPFLIEIIVPGFSDLDKKELLNLTRILLFSPIFLGFSSLFSSVIQSFRRFFIYALSPVLYNIGIIIGVAFFSPRFGLAGIVWGVVLGAVMHLLIQVPSVLKLGFLPRFSRSINWEEIKKVAMLSFPRTIGLGLNQIVLIFITAIASMFAVGSIAIFNLSYNLQSVPLTIVGVSYSVAAFPTLAKFFVRNKKEEFFKTIISSARHIIFWSMPISAIFIVLRAQIVRVLFGYGKFGWTDTRLTAAALAIFSVSIVAQALIILFVRGFYAAGKTVRPVVINVFSSLFIVSGSFFLVEVFNFFEPIRIFFETILRVRGINGTVILMLPLAFSLGTILNVFLLCGFFKKDFDYVGNLFQKTFFQVLVSSFLTAFVTYMGLDVFDNFFDINKFIGIFLQGLFSGILGILAGFTLLKFMKNKELEEIIDSFKQKFWKEEAIVPEQEDLS